MIQQLKNLVIIVSCIILSINNSSAQAISVGFVSVMTTDQKSIHIIAMLTDEIKASKFIYYRADNNSNVYKEIGRSGANSFTDTNVDANKEAYCYKVSYLDYVGKESEMSQPFCSVFLSAEGKNKIKWTPFTELINAEPVVYYIDLVNEDGSINSLTSERTEDLSAYINDIQDIKLELEKYDKAKIRIRAIQPTSFSLNNSKFTNHPITVYSNIITVFSSQNVFLPTAFTPNNDGTNDIFLGNASKVREFNMTIYNQWGNIVFESFDINNGWDGMFLGQSSPCPAGTYLYKISGKFNSGTNFEKLGSVLIIR
jgi:gliding motility-associated-like protein